MDVHAWRNRAEMAHERIRDQVRETPVEIAPLLAPDFRGRVFLKLEHLQQTGSFKFRGATNKIARLSATERRSGVVTASNGNHGLAVAAAARAERVPCEVFVSTQVSDDKLQRIEAEGATTRIAGGNPLDAELAARRIAVESDRVYISPYNDPDVIAGQGTIGVELHRQLPELDAVFVAVGGGGLIGGIGAYLKAVSPQTEIVGCWPESSPVLYESMRAGTIVDVAEEPTLSESTAGLLEPESITLPLCRDVIDRAVLVSETDILRAMRLMLATEHWIIEGAAGVATAAFLQLREAYIGKTVAIVICGRNLSPDVLRALTSAV